MDYVHPLTFFTHKNRHTDATFKALFILSKMQIGNIYSKFLRKKLIEYYCVKYFQRYEQATCG